MKGKRVIRKTITDFLNARPYEFRRTGKGKALHYEAEVFADYRDMLDNREARKICEAENPWEAFREYLFDAYNMAAVDEMDELEDSILDSVPPNSPYFRTEEQEEYFRETLHELVSFYPPEDHFLSQQFPVNIIMDTGDGNYDYVLNTVYPAWDGEQGAIQKKASIAWLAQTQGYTRGNLRAALKKGDIAPSEVHGFLDSMRQELANTTTHMNAVTFLVEMSLKQILELNQAIRNGVKKTANIIVGKKTMTGLFDPWNGAGGPFEIELEKDVKIPLHFISSILPDAHEIAHCSVAEVYGMCRSAWKNTIVRCCDF